MGQLKMNQPAHLLSVTFSLVHAGSRQTFNTDYPNQGHNQCREILNELLV